MYFRALSFYREIEGLKGQLKLVSMRNKTQAHESRQLDIYVSDIESRNRNKEKEIQLLRKEIKDYKIEVNSCFDSILGDKVVCVLFKLLLLICTMNRLKIFVKW